MNVTGIATLPLIPGISMGPNPAAGRNALLDAARRALAGADNGRVALRLSGVPEAPHRRRVLKVLLQDAAQTGGGQVFETTAGELLLLGAQDAAVARAAAALGRLAGSAPLVQETWQLPADGARLMAWAETTSLQPANAAPPLTAGLAGLDALLAGLTPELVLRRRSILRLGARTALPGRLLEISAAALAAEFRALAEDADLRRHAEETLIYRLLPRLAAAGPMRPQGQLLLPLPAGFVGLPAPRPGLVGVLPLLAAADPDALAERRAGLAKLGWGLAVGGLDAAALRLVALAAIPADWLLVQWSAALAALNPSLGPGGGAGRCLLVGCDGPEALSWGMARGVTHFAGPHVETLLAAVRLDGCRQASGCTQRQCGERAAATAAAARIGCRNHALLDATLPQKPAARDAAGDAARDAAGVAA